jgi:hypothetical protein
MSSADPDFFAAFDHALAVCRLMFAPVSSSPKRFTADICGSGTSTERISEETGQAGGASAMPA